jgi:hypothetical protein
MWRSESPSQCVWYLVFSFLTGFVLDTGAEEKPVNNKRTDQEEKKPGFFKAGTEKRTEEKKEDAAIFRIPGFPVTPVFLPQQIVTDLNRHLAQSQSPAHTRFFSVATEAPFCPRLNNKLNTPDFSARLPIVFEHQ